jgi:hypothetical protein
MLTAEVLEARRSVVETAADLRALRDHLALRATPLLRRMPVIPAAKALLSMDGGVCPQDGATLDFHPWSPGSHRCPACGRSYSGERHDRAWARFQHLWLAERTAELAALAVLGEHPGAAERATELLEVYAGRYLEYPNRDNVLGPSRLFFSTYLESIWITGYLAAASMLREAGLLADSTAEGVSSVADEAANLIGEFDEGLSNRQTWHNAALAAIAVWFEDEELAGRVVEGPTGIIAHLMRGFGEDGMWYEGENYHLFALRGELLAMGWAAQAGVDILADARLAGRLAGALRAPAVTALPDRTFPARRDSRYGVSLAQPMFLELWEVGLARLGDTESELWSWLGDLYRAELPPPQRFDSYLHDAGDPTAEARPGRTVLSWWALLEMLPELPTASLDTWQPGAALLESQGLAVLRRGLRYASLECGIYGGGHGHPDRLHLTLHDDGVHWLPDPGTGSYVTRDLFWYRSTLAHNAPRLDGVSQPPADARCLAFAVEADWAWARGGFGSLTRSVVAGPEYVLDLVEFADEEPHLVELAWHPAGSLTVLTPGEWSAATLDDEFVSEVERFAPGAAEAIAVRASAAGAALGMYLRFDGELLRAKAPGLPGLGPALFLLARCRGRASRFLAVLTTGAGAPVIRDLRVQGDLIEVETGQGVDRHVAGAEGWDVTREGIVTRLRGQRRVSDPPRPLVDLNRPTREQGVAGLVTEPPALDGTLNGFPGIEPLVLDYEDQYRRSEDPYPGPDAFAATAVAGWGDGELYLGVNVRTDSPVFRPASAPPLLLDNEPDDIHSDGVQVYLRPADSGPVYGFLIVPDPDADTVRAAGVRGTAGTPDMVRGGWRRTSEGYLLTIALTLPGWEPRHGDELGFDLLVNRMEPGRVRRAGQLAWSGGGGWVYLRGDRQDPAGFGVLELR